MENLHSVKIGESLLVDELIFIINWGGSTLNHSPFWGEVPSSTLEVMRGLLDVILAEADLEGAPWMKPSFAEA